MADVSCWLDISQDCRKYFHVDSLHGLFAWTSLGFFTVRWLSFKSNVLREQDGSIWHYINESQKWTYPGSRTWSIHITIWWKEIRESHILKSMWDGRYGCSCLFKNTIATIYLRPFMIWPCLHLCGAASPVLNSALQAESALFPESAISTCLQSCSQDYLLLWNTSYHILPPSPPFLANFLLDVFPYWWSLLKIWIVFLSLSFPT